MERNIAIMITTLSGGGAERIVSTISLYKNDSELPILLMRDEVEYPYCGKIITLPELNSTGSKGIRRTIRKKLVRVLKKLNVGWAYTQGERISFLKKFKQENKIDVTLSYLPKANLYNILSKKTDKTIISVRNFMDVAQSNEIYEGLLFSKTIQRQIKRLYKKADYIIALSNPIRDKLISDFGVDSDKIRTIYNPFDIDRITQLSEEALSMEHIQLTEGAVFISAARFSKEKGLHHLIRAFSEVKKNITDAKLLLIGKGPMQSELEALARDLQLHESVIFPGFQTNPFKFMKNSSIFVFPSLAEGFGNVLIEAMVCGLPVIATNCLSGPREIIAPGTSYEQAMTDFSHEQYGILCPVCDGVFREADTPLTVNEQILANAMTSLAIDKECREAYIEKGYTRVQDFSIDKIMSQYMDVLESV